MIIESTHIFENKSTDFFHFFYFFLHMQASAVFPLDMDMKRFSLLLPVCLLTISFASGGITRRGMRITDAGSETKKSRK